MFEYSSITFEMHLLTFYDCASDAEEALVGYVMSNKWHRNILLVFRHQQQKKLVICQQTQPNSTHSGSFIKMRSPQSLWLQNQTWHRQSLYLMDTFIATLVKPRIWTNFWSTLWQSNHIVICLIFYNIHPLQIVSAHSLTCGCWCCLIKIQYKLR